MSRLCQQCGAEISASRDPRSLNCSIECTRRGTSRRYLAKLNVRRLADKALMDRPCVICGEQIAAAISRHSHVCSDECGSVRTKRRVAEEWQREWALIVAAREPRACVHCGGVIGPERRTDARYCCASCCAMARASSRRGGSRDPVSRAYIIARDKSRCHLCGKRCERDEIHIDHLIPVSLGGKHVPENLRVACAGCNTRKGARPANDQLMLVG